MMGFRFSGEMDRSWVRSAVEDEFEAPGDLLNMANSGPYHSLRSAAFCLVLATER